MDSVSITKTSAGSIACGVFAILIVFFLTAFPKQKIHEEINPVLKGPRSYKQCITDTVSQKNYLRYKSSAKERVYHSIILEASNRHRVDPALIKAIIMAESGYDPMAISKKGAVGLMQLMPATATSLGVEDLFNPMHNVNAGVRYFKKLLTQFKGDLQLALAAYNAGSTNVRKYQGIPPYKATRHYIKKVFQYYQYYQGGTI
ncbi:MAG: lytic transglycosylase domain-containing protein [Deltaproteobacteria bacterium]|nr:lytic transglycosylase domain-containing protein [Deltaproteobacteria bacterium]